MSASFEWFEIAAETTRGICLSGVSLLLSRQLSRPLCIYHMHLFVVSRADYCSAVVHLGLKAARGISEGQDY